MAGFTHPILGTDHAIVILGIGILTYTINKFKGFAIFASFLIAMIIGGLLGIGNEATFAIEKFIAVSIIVTGLLILGNKSINKVIIVVCLAAFGFAHGYAHGAEMPETSSALVYITGYSLGALLMAAIGALIGRIIDFPKVFKPGIYVLGGIIILSGLYITFG